MSTKPELERVSDFPFECTHIGVVTKDLNRTVARYEALGAGPFKRFRLPDAEFVSKRRCAYGIDVSDHVYDIAYGQMGTIGVEIFQLISCPNPDKNFSQQHLEKHGEGIWHIGHDCQDMKAGIAWMEKAGYKVVGEAESMDGTLMCYFDTRDGLGYLFQAHQVTKGGPTDLLTNQARKK